MTTAREISAQVDQLHTKRLTTEQRQWWRDLWPDPAVKALAEVVCGQDHSDLQRLNAMRLFTGMWRTPYRRRVVYSAIGHAVDNASEQLLAAFARYLLTEIEFLDNSSGAIRSEAVDLMNQVIQATKSQTRREELSAAMERAIARRDDDGGSNSAPPASSKQA